MICWERVGFGRIVLELVLLAGIWLIPFVLVMPAKRLRGANRWRWLLIIALTSWIGFIAFSMVADRYPRNG
jgi:hypothetical protein